MEIFIHPQARVERTTTKLNKKTRAHCPFQQCVSGSHSDKLTSQMRHALYKHALKHCTVCKGLYLCTGDPDHLALFSFYVYTVNVWKFLKKKFFCFTPLVETTRDLHIEEIDYYDD